MSPKFESRTRGVHVYDDDGKFIGVAPHGLDSDAALAAARAGGTPRPAAARPVVRKAAARKPAAKKPAAKAVRRG